jgi:hypothetical protein
MTTIYTQFQSPTLSGISVMSTSQICMAAMFLIIEIRKYNDGAASSARCSYNVPQNQLTGST